MGGPLVGNSAALEQVAPHEFVDPILSAAAVVAKARHAKQAQALRQLRER
jgi:hypothetical protein